MGIHLGNQATCLQTRAADPGEQQPQPQQAQQAQQAQQLQGRWAADYLGRVEHWAEDFGEVLARINGARRNASLPPVPAHKRGARQNQAPCSAGGDQRRRRRRRQVLEETAAPAQQQQQQGGGGASGGASGGTQDSTAPSGSTTTGTAAAAAAGCPQRVQWGGRWLEWNGSGEVEGYGSDSAAFWAAPHLHCLEGVQRYYSADLDALSFRRLPGR